VAWGGGKRKGGVLFALCALPLCSLDVSRTFFPALAPLTSAVARGCERQSTTDGAARARGIVLELLCPLSRRHIPSASRPSASFSARKPFLWGQDGDVGAAGGSIFQEGAFSHRDTCLAVCSQRVVPRVPRANGVGLERPTRPRQRRWRSFLW